MEYYCLRITCETLTRDDVIVFLDKYSSLYCLAEESGKVNKHRHFHIYMESIIKIETIRSALKKLCGKGNKSYSLKRTTDGKNPIEYLAYLLKEDECADLSQLDMEVFEKAVACDLSKKKQKVPVAKQILASLPEYVDEGDILKAILQYHFDNDIMPRRFQVQGIYDYCILMKKGVESAICDWSQIIHK